VKTLFVFLTIVVLVAGCGQQETSELSLSSGDKTSLGKQPVDSPSMTTKSRIHVSFDFSGISPKDALPRVVLKARQWNPTASLQAVLANKWELFGDPLTRSLNGMKVSEWRFIFLSGNKISNFIVTDNDVRIVKEEIVPQSLPPDSPLASPSMTGWEIDAASALNTAFQEGIRISQGPWLWMRNVGGKWEPVWTILTSTTGYFVSAKTGQLISKEKIK
jgi:hypothetical protein